MEIFYKTRKLDFRSTISDFKKNATFKIFLHGFTPTILKNHIDRGFKKITIKLGTNGELKFLITILKILNTVKDHAIYIGLK